MKKKIITLIILIIIFGGGVVVFLKLNKVETLTKTQEDQAAERILGRKIKEGNDNVPDKITRQGKYFDLTYPGYATVRQSSPSANINDNELESLELRSEQPKFIFAVHVFKASSSIDEYSAIVFRRQQKKIYQESTAKIGAQNGVEFTKDSEGAEKSAFVEKGSKIYSFAITGNNSADIFPVFDQIISSAQLKD